MSDDQPPHDPPPPPPPPPAPKDLPRAWPEAWDAPLPPPPPPPADPNARYAPGYRDTGGRPGDDPGLRDDPRRDRSQEGAYPPDAFPPSDPFQARYRSDPSPTTDVYAQGYEPTAHVGDAPYPPGYYPPPPPPPAYRPPYVAPTPARGVTFKRRESPQSRALAVPIAGLLLLLVGGVLIIWLLAGDRRPPPSVSPSPTQGGVLISPSGSPGETGEPTAEPSGSGEPSPSEEPSASEEASPSEEPSPSASASPEPSAEPSAPPTTAPPTESPALPTPQPTDPPPGVEPRPGETALKVTLGDGDFNGGRSGEYHGRSARWVYGQGTEDHTMSARFIVTGSPLREARLRIDGLDGEDQRKTPIRIRVNGVVIFTGANPLENDVCCGPGGAGNWSAAAFDFKASLLKPGENRISISNMASSGRVGVPFVMLDDARLLYLVKE